MIRKIFSLMVGLLFFAGFPLLGWGWGELHLFFQNPYRLGYIFMMVLVMPLVVIFVPDEGRSQGKGIKLMRKHKISLFLLQIISIGITLFAPYSDHHQLATFEDSPFLRAAGLLLAAIGYFLMNWSVLSLGKQFSVDVTIQANHQLIKNGPYQYIRHPRYLGIILFFGGICMVFNSGISLILVLVLLAVLIWRIVDEEIMMHAEFGKTWEAYRKNTFAMIPFVY
jgi:protein-S-isoprenylcysteine O-methyltransferase Ste14